MKKRPKDPRPPGDKSEVFVVSTTIEQKVRANSRAHAEERARWILLRSGFSPPRDQPEGDDN